MDQNIREETKIIMAFDACCEAEAALCKRTVTLFFTVSSSNLSRFTFFTSVVKEITFIFQRAVNKPVACFNVLLSLPNSPAVLAIPIN